MATQDKPVVVRLPSGAEYGLRSAAEAKRIYPNGTIVGYQDGSPFEDEAVQDAAPNLNDMSRDELNAYAERLGIPDPEGLPNKGAVVQAIEDFTA